MKRIKKLGRMATEEFKSLKPSGSSGSVKSAVSEPPISHADNEAEPANGKEPTDQVVPTNQRSDFASFIKSLFSFTGDLSVITCPSFLLNGLSLLEYSANRLDHVRTFSEISMQKSPEERLLYVLRWFVSSLYGSYQRRMRESKGGEKKPFNPILGERFRDEWDDGEFGTTLLISEQVSHHPPVSALYIENKKAGVYCYGHFGQKSQFKGTSMRVVQTGRTVVRLGNPQEVYVLTLPMLSVCSLLTGRPYVELSGKMYMRSSTNLTAVATFHPKPWLYGESNLVDGIVYRDTAGAFDPASERIADPTFTFSGCWTNKMTYVDLRGPGEPVPHVLFDVDASEPHYSRPIDNPDLDPLDSRVVWRTVANALKTHDTDTASREKSRIENEQRALRTKRATDGTQWLPAWFASQQDSDAPADVRLAAAYLRFAVAEVGDSSWIAKIFPFS